MSEMGLAVMGLSNGQRLASSALPNAPVIAAAPRRRRRLALRLALASTSIRKEK